MRMRSEPDRADEEAMDAYIVRIQALSNLLTLVIWSLSYLFYWNLTQWRN